MLGARATLLLAAVALLAGAAFDSPALYVPAISLALLVAGSRIWVRLAARHARIEPVLARPGRGSTGVEAGEGLEGIGAAGLDTRSIDFEIDGIRPYREGTPASRIHWPTVARVGEIVEHRLVSGADSSPLVALDSSSPDDTDA